MVLKKIDKVIIWIYTVHILYIQYGRREAIEYYYIQCSGHSDL